MIVKIHSRGVGRGSGPVGYLLGRMRDREGATLLRGDPDTIEQLIDGNHYAQRYTSGVLSFAEATLTQQQKTEIMDSFEDVLLPGLDADQRAILWVEHADKGRVELNFVVPNVELTSGKRLAPYYDRADRPRIDAWQTIVNATFALADPNDPARRRSLSTATDLPRDRQQAANTITDGLLALAEQGVVKDRASVVSTLEQAGFTVSRQTASSISITTPDSGKPLRLKGAIYERSFQLGEGLQAELDAAGERYQRERAERVQAARETLTAGVRAKREYNRGRYPRPESPPIQTRTQGMDLAPSDHTPDRINERRPDVVDRPADHSKPGHDRPAEPHTGRTVEQGRADPVEPLRQTEPVMRSGGDKAELRRRPDDLHDRETEVNHDGIGTAIIERIRSAIQRVRTVAERVREGYRQLTEAGSRLAETSAGLERESQRWHREFSRADSQIGRMIESKERAEEVTRKERQSHRVNDRGLSL